MFLRSQRIKMTTIAPADRWDYSDDQVDEDLAGELIEEDLAGTDLGGTDRGPEDAKLVNVRTRREENCMTYNVSDSSERSVCTPGSQYVIRCRICICPYMGNINNFCRPMPRHMFCEQAFPNFNYVPMGRRNNVNSTFNMTSLKPDYPIQIHNPHNHTKYKCEEPGKIHDDCYICECEQDHMIVAEHCFKSDSEACVDAEPTFISHSVQDTFISKLAKLFI